MKTGINLEDYAFMVFDIDGTLVGRDKRLHPQTTATLGRLKEHSILFTLATGLNLLSAEPFADELAVELPLILANGAILETRQGEFLYRATIPPAVTREVIHLCQEERQDLIIYIENETYILKMTDNIFPIYKHVADQLTEVGEWKRIEDRLDQASKCLVADALSEDNLNRIGAVFRERFPTQVDVVRSTPALVELMPKGVNKAQGLRKLAGILGIPLEKVIAFGDYDNDAEMLAAAGLGVAVGNASEKAKASADMLIDTVDEKGPAKFLEGLMQRS